MTVYGAHTAVQAALAGSDIVTDGDVPGLHELRLADLNESELESAQEALAALHTLDEQLAERTGAEPIGCPADTSGGGDQA